MNFKELININNMVFLAVATYVFNVVKGWLFNILDFIKRRYIMGITISNARMEDQVKRWLVDHCYSESSKRLLENNDLIIENSWNTSLAWGRYIIRLNRFCWAYIYSFQMKDVYSQEGAKNVLGVDIYGYNRMNYIKEIKDMLFPKIEEFKDIWVNNYNSNGMSFVTSIRRDYKRLFGGFVQDVEKVIDNFIDSKDIYRKYGRTYKTSILLYGPPGTGKTSIIKHLAEKYKASSIQYIDGLINSDQTTQRIGGMLVSEAADNKTLKTLGEQKRIPLFCVIEDIDKSVLDVGDSNNRDSKDDIIVKKGKLLDKLMQLLDSNISPDNVIFIITTNHIDLIPDPLLRSGRIDHKVYVGPLKKEEAKQMVSYYGSNLELEKDEYNPADLEKMLFEEIMNKR